MTLSDPEFLALLVHQRRVDRDRAQALVGAASAGGGLDRALAEELDLAIEAVEELRRTHCGERPEIPGYRLEERIGRGGTADVWVAHDRRQGKRVALKVLRPAVAADPKSLRAFVAEAKLLTGHPHPNLVGCEGAARAGSTIFMRLELIPGRTLLEHLDDGRAFDESEALRVVLDVARVLEHLEARGVLHRDVKPGNVMLTERGRVVLIDLGFAVAESDAGGADGSRVAEGADSSAAAGTVAYLSPEEAAGRARGDARSDIYSLGVTLFHLVVGRLPFEGDDREILAQQIFASLQSKELQGRALSPHVQYFIEKMMAKEADDRYQSWSELIGDVSAQVEGRESLDLSLPVRAGRSPRSRRRRR